MPVAMERTPRSARRSRSAFLEGCTNHLLYVADVEASGATINGELNIGLDTEPTFSPWFPLKGEGRARLIGTVRQEAEHQHDELSWNDVSRRVLEWMPIDVERVNWFSTYRVHHRVAAHFRKGRAFLLGDAAHIHSPVGGQGMNTGIGDAVNLAWKLAAVMQGRAEASLLDSYEPERIAFRPAPGGDHRSGIYRCNQLEWVGSADPVAHRATLFRALLSADSRTAIDVSYRLTDSSELS